MRDIHRLKVVEARYNHAMQRGDAVMALKYLREMTSRSLSAEWETKEDMQQTICQLENYCESLETRVLLFVPVAFVLLAVGAVWGNDVMYNILLWLAWG